MIVDAHGTRQYVLDLPPAHVTLMDVLCLALDAY